MYKSFEKINGKGVQQVVSFMKLLSTLAYVHFRKHPAIASR